MFHKAIATFILSIPPLQTGEGTYSRTSQFLYNFFFGLNGIGYWVLFLILVIAAIVFMLYDSQKRNIPATSWKIGVILCAMLILPAMLFRFSVTPNNIVRYQELEEQIYNLERYQEPADWMDRVDELRLEQQNLPVLTGYQELITYLGILGGLLAVALAAAYYVTYRGLQGCNQGHIYQEGLPSCPECARERLPLERDPYREPVVDRGGYISQEDKTQAPEKTPKRKTQAWLAETWSKRSHQLYINETTIGRSNQNDIVLSDRDKTVSRQHCKITEENGHFRIQDVGSDFGTYVNGQKISGKELLYDEDEIKIGQRTTFRFKS